MKMRSLSHINVGERLTPELLHQGLEDWVNLMPELGERAAKSLVAEQIGGQVLRQTLAEEAQTVAIAA